MSKNKSNRKDNDTSDHYKLNTKAVDRLVNANKIEIPNDKKLNDPAKQYRSGFLDKIPSVVKSLFVKFWFNGAVCYFIFWGLSLYLNDTLDMIFIMAIVLGMITDILVNNTLRFIETIPGENAKWMMFPKKKLWTFFANILYSFIILFCVINFYEAINISLNYLIGTSDKIYIGVEPILFGIFYMLFDLLFIGIKRFIFTIVNDAKNKVDKQIK